jgi:hypothetical protein
VEEYFKSSFDRRIRVLRKWWTRWSAKILRGAIVIMLFIALVWLGYQFWRLVLGSAPIWPSSRRGAIDLNLNQNEVQHWFAGSPIYRESKYAVYPPASYVILWPFFGWLGFTAARWLWAITAVVALYWFIRIILKESGAKTPLERLFVTLMPLSMYATGAAIGNGQVIDHLLPVLIAGILRLQQKQAGWRKDLLNATLLLGPLVKPNITVPFFWIILFVPNRLRPVLLVSIGYGALTLLGTSFQESGLLSLFHDWVKQITVLMLRLEGGHTNLHSWLLYLGLKEWNLPASAIVLGLLGLWTYRNRKKDLWLLLGVTAIVARLWTYHLWYDDLLMIVPMISLFRIAKRGTLAPTDRRDVFASILFFMMILANLAPGGRYLLPPPWKNYYITGQVLVWIITLTFLIIQTRQEREIKRGMASSL